MLVGSGGVVALVLGAWSVMWAVRATPGRELREWYPIAAAFVGAMFAFALLTAQSEVVTGLIGYFRAEPEERPDEAAAALSYSVRPLFAAVLGTVALVVAVLASRGKVSPTPRPARWPAAVAVGAMGLATAAGMLDLVLMRRGLDRITSGEEPLTAVLPRLHVQATLGALFAIGTLGIAAWIGVREALRVRRELRQTDG
jgi:hypothetical protein